MWDQTTIRTIKVPPLQTLLLVVLLVGSLTAIIWVSILVSGETPRPTPSGTPPNSSSASEGPAAWLSAWSTFWSAIAGGLAAIGTAGALLIAAFGYKHQVAEKERQEADRRQQAKDKKEAEAKTSRSRALQVSLLTKQAERILGHIVLEVFNGTSSPIRNVMLVCIDRKGTAMGQNFTQVLAAGQSLPLERPRNAVDTAWARFTDADDKTWKVYVNGDLEEV